MNVTPPVTARTSWRLLGLVPLLLLAASLPTQTFGCEVPVFRYALERWPVDPYRAEASEHVVSAVPGLAAMLFVFTAKKVDGTQERTLPDETQPIGEF